MSRFKSLWLLAALLACTSVAFAQKKGTGMIFDPPSLRSIPYKAKLTSQSYKSVPAAASLERFCPTPGDGPVQHLRSLRNGLSPAYHPVTTKQPLNFRQKKV